MDMPRRSEQSWEKKLRISQSVITHLPSGLQDRWLCHIFPSLVVWGSARLWECMETGMAAVGATLEQPQA